jgi:hypothetical protein
MTPQTRIRRLGWIVLLALLTGLYLLLHFQVQAVHSDIVRAERRIVSLEQEKLLLATEFETRANQTQLAAWNQVDFGYTAPVSGQFLNGERQLAALGAPRRFPGQGSPIQLAQGGLEEGDVPAVPGADPQTDDPGVGPVGPLLAVVDRVEAQGGVRLASATLAGAGGRVALSALGAAAE